MIHRGQSYPRHPWNREASACFQENEIDIVDRAVFPITVHQVDKAPADAPDRRDIELHRADHTPERFGPKLNRPFIGPGRIFDPDRKSAHRRPMLPRETLTEAVGFTIDDEIDVALPIKHHLLGAVARNSSETHALKEARPGLGVLGSVFNELKAIGTHRVIGRGYHYTHLTRQITYKICRLAP